MSSEFDSKLADYLEQFYTNPDVASDVWADSVSAPELVSHLDAARIRARERMESIGIEPHGLLFSNE